MAVNEVLEGGDGVWFVEGDKDVVVDKDNGGAGVFDGSAGEFERGGAGVFDGGAGVFDRGVGAFDGVEYVDNKTREEISVVEPGVWYVEGDSKDVVVVKDNGSAGEFDRGAGEFDGVEYVDDEMLEENAVVEPGVLARLTEYTTSFASVVEMISSKSVSLETEKGIIAFPLASVVDSLTRIAARISRRTAFSG